MIKKYIDGQWVEVKDESKDEPKTELEVQEPIATVDHIDTEQLGALLEDKSKVSWAYLGKENMPSTKYTRNIRFNPRMSNSTIGLPRKETTIKFDFSDGELQ